MRFVQFGPSTSKAKIDLKDKKILAALASNARTPIAHIARQAGLSRDSASYRIKNLTEGGVIQGYITLVDIRKFDYESYHIFLNLSHPTKEIEEKIIQSLKDFPFVRAILKFSGKYDFELAIIAKSIADFDEKLTTVINLCSQYLQNYEILIISRNYVSNVFPGSFSSGKSSAPMITLEKKKTEAPDIDEKDIELLKYISNNAIAPLNKIGTAISLSSDAVNYRMKKMKDSSVILNFLPVINYSSLDYSVYAILLSLNNLNEKKEMMLKELLKTDENVLWAVKTIGKYNVLFYLCVKNVDDLHSTIIKLRSHFREDLKEYEALIAQEEYKYVYLPEGLKLKEK